MITASIALVLTVAVGAVGAPDTDQMARGERARPSLVPRTGTVPLPPHDWEGWKFTWRDDRFNMWLGHLQFHTVPNFTTTGFEMVDIPGDLHEQMLQQLYTSLNHTDVFEKDVYVNIMPAVGEETQFSPQYIFNNRIHQELQAMHEGWAGVALERTAAFGIRVYRNGNVLKKHVDRVGTHIVSSILHIGRDVDEVWPLAILDNDGVPHTIDLVPGKMLFYESARLLHWRPRSLRGRYYASTFLHYRPVGWQVTFEDVVASLPPGWDHGTSSDKQHEALLPEGPVADQGRSDL
mmetsp:Transcript_8490/g.21777  ORF Transcript_8490/g.21777 Transcript_8490/m.21777 type:complete len:292 (+) Transcript_8490:70-945(+)